MDLTAARQKANLPREKAAPLLGVSLSTLARWEKGISKLPAAVIPKIREVYGLTEVEVMQLLELESA